MSNFLQDIEKAIGAEEVELCGVRIGGRHSLSIDTTPGPEGLLDWDDETKAILDYEYDRSFGGAECHEIHIWTPTRVLFIATYNGATWVASVPRHPTGAGPIDLIGGG